MTAPGNLKPLLRRVLLLPGESLPSVLARLTIVNFCDPPSMLSRFCTERLAAIGIRDRLDRPQRPETFALLASLTGLSPYHLAQATIHRFAAIMNLKGAPNVILLPDGHPIELVGKNTLDDFRTEDDAQYCPACLKQAAFHRLAWVPRAVSVCLEHECFLVENCQHCGRQLNTWAIVNRRCMECDADLIEVQLTPLHSDPFGLYVQEAIHSWLGLYPLLPSSFWRAPAQPARVLYQVLYGLYSSLETRMDWEYLYWSDVLPKEADPLACWSKRSMTPACSYVLYATAFKGLVDWPYGFLRFLSEYRAYSDRHDRRLDEDGLREISTFWLRYQWDTPEYGHVQDAYQQFLQQERKQHPYDVESNLAQKRPELFHEFEYMNIERAAAKLYTSEDVIRRLIQAGKLTGPASTAQASTTIWVSRRDVSEIRDRWTVGVPLARAAQLMRLPEDFVIDLARMGLLQAERGPTAPDEGPDWLFHRPVIEGFLDRGMAKAAVMDYEILHPMTPLISAVQSLSGLGVTGASLIPDVLAGDLQAFRCAESDDRLSDLVFLDKDLCQFANGIIGKHGWIEQDEIAYYMGVKRVMATRWLDNGLLKPIASYADVQYFDRAQLDRFIAALISIEDAIQILAIHETTLRSWVRNGRLKPVSGPTIDGGHRYMFRREDVERLRPERRLSVPQMMKRLGITRTQLEKWVRAGQLKPMSGPGVDRASRYLFEATVGLGTPTVSSDPP